MALFRIQVYKSLAGDPREWANRYFVSSDSLSSAVDAAVAIATREEALHSSATTIERVRTDDNTPGTDVFDITTIGHLGTWYSNASEQYIPLFNAVRVDIDVSGGGRPSRKYYRPPIGEGHIVNGIGDATTYVGVFDTQVAGMISDCEAIGSPICDPDGQIWLTPHTKSAVTNRKRHRKRKKTV